MTMLPDEIGELKELERLDVRMETGHWKLDFSHNKLTTLPDEIAEVKLKMLSETRLCLISRELSIAPEAVSDLTELEELDLPDNYLEELPTSIRMGECENGHWTLVLINNQMTTMPDETSELKELEWLNGRIETGIGLQL